MLFNSLFYILRVDILINFTIILISHNNTYKCYLENKICIYLYL